MAEKRKRWMVLLCTLMVLLTVPCMKTEAASAKTKALKAYEKFLSTETVVWDSNYEVSAKDCKFAVAYIDKNDAGVKSLGKYVP